MLKDIVLDSVALIIGRQRHEKSLLLDYVLSWWESFSLKSLSLITPSIWNTSHSHGLHGQMWFSFWNKIREFFFFLSQDKQEDMKTILEGIDPAKHQVRVAFDACKLLHKE